MSSLQNIRVLQSEIPPPHPKISVRRMEVTDCAATVQLIQRAMNPEEGAYAETSFRHHFECQRQALDDGRQLYVGVIEESIRAVVGLHYYNWGPRENIWLSWFAVDPPFQNQGYGTALLRSIIAEAQTKGYSRMLIETYDSNDFQKAITFYHNRGFRGVGRIEDYLPDGTAMIVLARELSGGECDAVERITGCSVGGHRPDDWPLAGRSPRSMGLASPSRPPEAG
jgi:ribosomal protein S18 acetylase RimI-like enzyme